MKRLLVLAGEASGDLHASMAIRQFKELYPQLSLEIKGLGGEHMREAGVRLFKDTTSYGKIGYLESLSSIFQLLSLLREVKALIHDWRPDLLLLVDSPGFNLRLLPFARKEGIPTLIYFGPSAWIWGERRAKKVVEERASVAAVFKPEEELYQRLGGDVHFVGHPVIDQPLDQEYLKRLEEEIGESIVIGLLPGSRRGEVEELLPLMLEAASQLKREYPSLTFILPLATTISRKDYQGLFKENPEIKVIHGYSREVMELSTLLITASGTATLEAALLQRPMVILYRVSPLTAFIGRRLGIREIGMPNILLGERVVPELIQEDLSLDAIIQEVSLLLDSPQLREEISQRLYLVRERVGSFGALDRMAELMRGFL